MMIGGKMLNNFEILVDKFVKFVKRLSKMNTSIDLNYVPNKSCLTQCNANKRREITENDLCTYTCSTFDNLRLRCVGEWGKEKIYYLTRYFEIFSKGMHKKWNGKLNYIEICSGPGRCISRNNGLEFDGTALSILKNSAFQFIEKAIFFDFNDTIVNVLNQRIQNQNISKAIALKGDYNQPIEICERIEQTIDTKSLNLVFIDPTDCSVPFSLIHNIDKRLHRTDFIINIASGTDLTRNLSNALQNQMNYRKSILKYSRFLGSTGFFQEKKNIELANRGDHEKLRNSFREAYKQSLTKIGYVFIDFHRIRHYYELIFASKHNLGLDFWKKAKKIEFDGQRRLF